MDKYKIRFRITTTLTRKEIRHNLKVADGMHLLDHVNLTILVGSNGDLIVDCDTVPTLQSHTWLRMYCLGFKHCGDMSDLVIEKTSEDKNNPRDVETVMHKIREIFSNAALHADNDGQAIIYTHCKVTETFEEID